MSQLLQRIADLRGGAGWLTVNSFEINPEKRRAAIAASYTIADDGPTRTLVIYGILMSLGRGANPQLSESEFRALEDLIKHWHEPMAGTTNVQRTLVPERVTNSFDVNVGNKVRRAALMSTKPALYVAYGAASVIGKSHALKERTRKLGQSWWRWYEKESAHFLYNMDLHQAMEEAVSRVSKIYSVNMPSQQHLIPKLEICGRLKHYKLARDIVLQNRPESAPLFFMNI